jgi:nicotinamide-nucleotide amidase
MDLEVVTVGTELLLGFTLDKNAADIARALAPVGVRVARRTTVADDSSSIARAVAESLDRSGFVIVTGGLGPTRDDITKRAVAELFDAPLELDEDYLQTLKDRFAKLGRGPMPQTNTTQAEVPRGAVVLPNPRGTAPGLWLAGATGTAVLLPGVPREMRALLEREVIPRILEAVDMPPGGRANVVRSLTLRTTGVTESALADKIGDLCVEWEQLSLAYVPGLSGVDLRLTAWQLPADEAERKLATAAAALRPVLGRNFYGEGDVELAAVVLQRLRSSGLRLATAESCTGGLIGAKLTAVPGSSDVYLGGLVSYSNTSKTRDLGVSEGVLQQHGAVSEPVARSMVAGVCSRFGTETGVAVTGVAGPGGGTVEKPLGTVCIAAQWGEREDWTTRWFPGEREEVRQRSAQAALDMLRRLGDDSGGDQDDSR